MSGQENPIDTPIEQSLRGPRLNLAIGPNCPVRCEGCYNSFGNTSANNELITADEIFDFAEDVKERGIDGVTLSGGDPLFHPEIETILFGLHKLDYRVKLDTVGTGLLDDSRIVFKGKGVVPQIKVDSIKGYLESVTLPLDGIDQETISHFRRGRKNLSEETKVIANMLAAAGVVFEFNTVVNSKNANQLDGIKGIAEELGAKTWHVFEYDTSGPNPSSKKADLALEPGKFNSAVSNLGGSSLKGMRIDIRTQDSRIGEGAYFFINDAGQAWCPAGSEAKPIRNGHITNDRAAVLTAYDRYLDAFWKKFYS